MSRVRCLYCDAENDAVVTAGFCENCGKKLPPASLAHKRREPLLRDQTGGFAPPLERTPPPQASAWLFTAALIHLVGCGGVVVLGPLLLPREQLNAAFIPELLLISVAVLVSFAALGWWARSRPIAAVLLGGVVYLGLAVVEALLVPGLALLGLPLKIAILALLIQALRVSRKPHRLTVDV
jgi:hypothetical protein